MTRNKEQLERIVTEQGIDIDKLAEVMPAEFALERVSSFIKVGRRGWGDPTLLAALQVVYEMAMLNWVANGES